MATAILANIGYEVAAVTGRPEASNYLKDLGASQIVERGEINEAIKRPLKRQHGLDALMLLVVKCSQDCSGS